MKNYKDYISENVDKGFPLSQERYDSFYNRIFNAEQTDDTSMGLTILHNIKKRSRWCFKSEYNQLQTIISNLPKEEYNDELSFDKPEYKRKANPVYSENKEKIKIKYNDKYYRACISSYKYSIYNYCSKFLDSLKKKKPDENGFIEITQKQKNFLNGIVSGQVNQESYPVSF